ncbi:antitoxin Xre/MbcA/ParS toxin-binding domain-containing protein [Mesorhizobium yinganensis]|uniref:antitoxin Xre/MbcA/ParS toxin-binding domain-containing protein n=1 Tax=Mesorhizobium yinganensis TaxID=3157707 RepID=UPI0032B76E20
MSSAQSTVARFIGELETNGGLRGTDIANITDVSKATVSRWRSGAAKPQPSNELRISDLHYVVGRLQEYYSADEIRTWLYARHPQLDGARAIDLIHADRADEVLQVLNRLDAGAYL